MVLKDLPESLNFPSTEKNPNKKFPNRNLNGSVLITTAIIIKNSAVHLAYLKNLHVKSFKLSNLRDIS